MWFLGIILSQLQQGIDVRRTDRNAVRDLGDTRVPGGGGDPNPRIVLPETPCEGMLAAAAAHEKDVHCVVSFPLFQAWLNASRARAITSVTVLTASRALSL